MRNYSEFDYRKVIAILEQLQYDMEIASIYYKIEIFTFEEIGADNFRALLDFGNVEILMDLNFFPLIRCCFYLGDNNIPLFVFHMGETECQVVFMNEAFGIKNPEIMDITVDVIDQSWRDIISLFISRVKKVFDVGLRIEKDLSLN